MAVLFCVAVDLYARFVLKSPHELVTVTAMVSGARELLTDSAFVVDGLARSMATIAITFAIAVIAGVLIAYLMYRWDAISRALDPFLAIFYAIPIFALYPILVVILGTGLGPIVALCTVFSAVVVITNAKIGFDSVDRTVEKLAASLEVTGLAYARRILLPTALPHILTGAKLALAYAFISVLAAEFILSPFGLGHVIADTYNAFATEQMYGAILVATVVAVAVNLAMTAVCQRLDWSRR
ncbi:ABC transporter permease subunit (plasmid) [Rhodococcus sp. USK10]|uniref:ABC transporter permease n=1 Tax=Rhodococcus sp. USK10 TaxID=2789739 RepID=UPI001C5E092A|nr:ABC transporter permease subunit [Rhodococcus sp. USK10]QYB00216.1 ABC transporter permease subunit [Rhodococcus sp. USK10]